VCEGEDANLWPDPGHDEAGQGSEAVEAPGGEVASSEEALEAAEEPWQDLASREGLDVADAPEEEVGPLEVLEAAEEVQDTAVSDGLEEAMDTAVFEGMDTGGPGDGASADGVEVGGLGWPCQAGEDCVSGFCVETPGGKVCTAPCSGPCPLGLACLPAGDAASTYLCLPRDSRLCQPCVTDEDCRPFGEVFGDVCMKYGALGSFCATPCDAGGCPPGYECTVMAGHGPLCLLPSGECQCSPLSMAVGAGTRCPITNQYGTCEGERQCGPGGLSPCNGPQPKAELCNNKDDDCDGLTDEDFQYDGILVWVDPKDTSKGQNTCKGIGECGRLTGLVECQGPDKAGCSTNPGGSNHLDMPEVCDNKDNDCDGVTDEDLTNVKDSDCLQTGVCLTGWNSIKAKCEKGVWLCDYTAVKDFEPLTEKTCDGLDNDCDGETDEDFVGYDWDGTPLGKGHSCGTGVCKDGIMQCNDLKNGLECSTAVLLKPEVCDGQDNDCDGLTDEDQTYQGAGVGQPCVGIGDCGNYPGKVECHSQSKKAVCSTNPEGSEPKNKPETCNGRDDDCNGLTDDGLDINSADCTCKVVGQCSKSNVDATCKNGQWKCDYGSVPSYESPAELSCDGLDNDCDGLTDEDFTFLDWNGQTKVKGQTCGTGVCAGGQVVCKSDGKGLVCSTASKAVAETCNGKDDDCDGETDENGAALCNDNDMCTIDTCEAGQCKNTVPPKTCNIGGQCVAEGTENPANQCQICNPAKNLNGWTNKADNSECNFDNNGCTQGDKCMGGQCKQGVLQTCSEKTDQCNTGRCVSQGANAFTCVADPKANNTPCDDGNLCTYSDGCVAGKCQGTAYSCDDKLECTTDSCNGKGGCSNVLQANWCLIGGQCIASGTQDPNNQCKACRPLVNAYVYSAKDNGVACDDGDACTDTDKCQNGACKGSSKTCNDNNQCTKDTCDPKTGCVFTAQTGAPCDDGNLCTKNDKCGGTDGKQCIGEAFTCNDGLTCTTDTCNGTGCDYTVISGYCVINNTCVKENELDPTNDCKSCQPGKDKYNYSNLPDNTACSDKNACTIGDKCKAGVCQSGGPVTCNDSNSCTVDTCDPNTGCVYTGQPGLACNDGNPCTKDDKCGGTEGKVCAGTSYSCDDQLLCTTDVCDGNGGCTHAVNDGYCVIGGGCVQSGAVDPTNQCKACIPTTDKYAYSNRANGTPCYDNDACTENDACKDGTCTGTAKVCKDNNPCTDDTCDKTTGCKFINLTGGTCDDGNPCTENDTCSSGTCVGSAKVCPQPNPDCSGGNCVCGTQTCDANKSDTCGPLKNCLCNTEPSCIEPNPQCSTVSGTVKCNCYGAVCDANKANRCDSTSQTCKCGSSDPCTDPVNPTCVGTGTSAKCQCGGVVCSPATADTCTGTECKCGTADACSGKNPTCVSGTCKCGSTVCGAEADTCSNDTCKCGTGAACTGGQKCCSGTCKTSC